MSAPTDAPGWFDLPLHEGYFVYALYTADSGDTPRYIGQSANLLTRAGAHLTGRRDTIVRIAARRCASKADMDATEQQLIAAHRPLWNRAGIPASAGEERAAATKAAATAAEAAREARLAETAQLRADFRSAGGWFKADEIAARLGCTVEDVNRYVTDGRLRRGGGPRSPRFHANHVIEMLEAAS
jgi:hypothetical protein